jgi:hypothetical protein
MVLRYLLAVALAASQLAACASHSYSNAAVDEMERRHEEQMLRTGGGGGGSM